MPKIRKPRVEASVENHLQNAQAFILGAGRILGEHEAVPVGLDPAFWLLVGFGLELGIKTIALARKRDPVEVEGWGHDLYRGMLGVAYAGCPFMDQEWVTLAFLMSEYHRTSTFRYTPAYVAEIAVPNPRDAMKALMRLLDLAMAEADVER